MSNFSRLQKGSRKYANVGYIYRVIDLCSQLFEIVAQNMTEFPDMEYNDLYMLCETLTKLKWSAVELLGEDSK